MMYKEKFHEIDISKIKILITGGAGFIGSNLVEYLLKYNVGLVRVLDNFSTGYLGNIEKYINYPNFELLTGDIRDINSCQTACEGIDYVLHQAALGSVPRSIEDPITTNEVNIFGFLNMLVAVKDCKVKRFIYAASSSTYGDSKELPKVEDKIGKPLSPYAVTKYVNELYADVFAKTYGVETIGLRYFNVFGPRQSPNGAYAAVIPLFIKAAKEGVSPFVNGDGEQTRDFTFVENVVQANLKAMLTTNSDAINEIYNVACGEKISLNELWKMININLNTDIKANYRQSRIGDIKDSLASIVKIKKELNYEVVGSLKNGIKYLTTFE